MLVRPFQNEFLLLHTLNPSVYMLSYNGFYQDYDSLFHIMDLQDGPLMSSPNSSLNICTLFYNTTVTFEVMDHFIRQLHKHRDKINTVAIVGVPANERGLFRLKLKKALRKKVTFRFFYSLEEAGRFLRKQGI